MRYYEIHVPQNDNAGRSYESALVEFRDYLLNVCGGYHRLDPVQGAWRDNGKNYVETMIPFHVACEPETFAKVLAQAFRIFHDQLAIFTAEIGAATIHERETK